MPEKFYLTTSIAYVNAKPHIGFAMEVIQGDVLARYHRAKGDEVYFLTGTDEHGQKLFQKAKEEGTTPQSLADQNSEQFEALTPLLNLSNDGFIRTTSVTHKKASQKMWRKLVDAGDIYKDKYKGYYCVGCESFILEKDLEDGNCLIHKKPPETIEEENYFFKLSRYSKQIGEKIEKDELRIVPRERKNEILAMIKDGLKDVSFSRPRKVLNWGVDVPDDPDQVMYVWCDALTNYLTGVGYLQEDEQYQKFWPADVHLIGKDILRFHSAIWIGMLLAAQVPLPKAIYVHGFITSEGQKMSKSLGNVVDPVAVVKEYSVDALRYYLMREIPTTGDGDFSQTRFHALYDGDLLNGLGNLLNRSVVMTNKFLEGKVEVTEGDAAVEKLLVEVEANYDKAIASFDLAKTLAEVFRLVDFGNQYVDEKKPWVLAKEDQAQLKAVLYQLLKVLAKIAELLGPFLPETSEKIKTQLGEETAGFTVKLGEPLFPKKEV